MGGESGIGQERERERGHGHTCLHFQFDSFFQSIAGIGIPIPFCFLGEGDDAAMGLDSLRLFPGLELAGLALALRVGFFALPSVFAMPSE